MLKKKKASLSKLVSLHYKKNTLIQKALRPKFPLAMEFHTTLFREYHRTNSTPTQTQTHTHTPPRPHRQ